MRSQKPGKSALLRRSQMHESAAQRDGDCLGTITGAKFLHDVLKVHFDRFFGYEEPFSDCPSPNPPTIFSGEPKP